MTTSLPTNSYFFFISILCSIVVLVIADSDDDTYFTTKLGNRIPRSFLNSRLVDVDESNWSNHIFELEGSGKESILVGSSFTHDFSDGRYETHSLRDPLSQATPQIFIDNKQIPTTNITYISLTTPTARILTDVKGSVFSVFREDSLLHPIDHKNKLGLFMLSPSTRKKSTNNTGNGNDYKDVIDGESSEELESSVRDVSHGLPEVGACLPSDSPAVLELAITFDSSLCQVYDADASKVVAVLTDYVNQAMIPFQYQTCIRHSIVHYSGYCDSETDPYREFLKRDSTSDMMHGIRVLWNSPDFKHSKVHRDYTYLFTYDKPPGGNDGITYNGAVCNLRFRYAWTTAKAKISTISHEIGHMFSAKHDRPDEDGIMNTKRDKYAQKTFSATSLKKIREYVPVAGSCLFDGSAANPYVVIRNHDYTCETGFGKKLRRPKKVTWKLVAGINPDEKVKTYPVYAYFKQASKAFELSFYVKNKDYRIKTYYRTPSMAKVTNIRHFGQPVDLPWEYMTTTVWSKWTWAELNRPRALRTCCGQKIYIHFYGRLCRKRTRRCSWTSITFTVSELHCS